jgi:small subunit ribosomal protein S1
VVRVGQRVEVLVQEVAPDRCRVALSLKRLCPNPWQTAAARYPVNQVFPAVITTLAPFGAFARLEEGLEGLIHTSEMPTSPGAAPKTSLAPGQGVQVRILQVEAARQRLSLSLKMEEDHESISLRRGEDGFQAVLSPLQRASQSQPVGSPTGGAGCAATQAVPVEAG